MGVYVREKNNKVRITEVDPPFDHPLLSSIELHVNPIYMIWNLGSKLDDIDIRNLDVPNWVQDDLARVHELFQAWEFDPEDAAATSGAKAAISERETVRSVTSEPDVAVSEPHGEDSTSSLARTLDVRHRLFNDLLA